MAFSLLLLTYFASSVNMLRLIEYRIPLPVSVEEYKLAQLYRVIQESKMITDNNEGVEIITNEPFEGKIPKINLTRKGQYTHKIFHLHSKIPRFVRMLAPSGSLEVHEKSWNSYPIIYTEISNPYMKDSFYVRIETTCRSGVNDLENVFQLHGTRLQMREVRRIDIAEGKIDPKEDPTLFKSQKTGRGPLDKDHWKENTNLYPTVTCYKLVDIKFRWSGLEKRVESMLEKFYTRLFIDFNRRLFTTIDEWYGMTLSDIRALEEKAKQELDQMRGKSPQLLGLSTINKRIEKENKALSINSQKSRKK